MDYGFSYDENGNITQISDGLNPILTGDYEYDPLDRLSEETKNSEARAYDYDVVGNRTQIRNPVDDSVLQANQYGTTSNRLTLQDGAAIGSDPVGNIIDWGMKGWTYDLRNRMKEYKEAGTAKAIYEYNGLGQRIKKTRPDQSVERTTLLHFNSAGQIIQETFFDSVNNPVETRSYIWADAMPVGYLKQIIVNGNAIVEHKLVFLHADQLDTPRVGTNEVGTIAWRWDSDAFGVGVAQEIDDGTTALAKIGLRMPGQLYDEESGAFYNYFRDYDPSLGRFIQSDPIGLQGGLNTYAYVGSNPLMYTDPLGLAWYTTGVDYHGTKNWTIGLLTRLATLDRGTTLNAYYFEHSTRDTIQTWYSHPDDPQNKRESCMPGDPAVGDTRLIEQSFGYHTQDTGYKPPGMYWSPGVNSPTWD
jgi:RHS repeat-associated protein